MKKNKGNYMVAHNIRFAVDYNTKIIFAINITQNPTDHYELPPIAERAIHNIQKNTKIHKRRHNILKPNKPILLSR